DVLTTTQNYIEIVKYYGTVKIMISYFKYRFNKTNNAWRSFTSDWNHRRNSHETMESDDRSICRRQTLCQRRSRGRRHARYLFTKLILFFIGKYAGRVLSNSTRFRSPQARFI